MDSISNDSGLELDSKNRKRVKECPCGRHNKDGKFVPFKDYDQKGYCHSCEETFLPESSNKTEPWEDFHKKWGAKATNRKNPIPNNPKKEPPLVNSEALKKSLFPDKTVHQIAAKNNFVCFLLQQFGEKITASLIETYFLGTSKYRNRATIFWLIHKNGNVRTGKVMLFDPKTGKRSEINQWVHSIKYGAGKFQLPNHLFFEHLLNNNSKPVAIAEGQKTAIISSVYFPQFIWLSAGSKQGLKLENCHSIYGRNVVLFPDLGVFNDWCKKAQELRKIAKVQVSDLLERKATPLEKKQGLDLADYLLKFPLENYKEAGNAGENQSCTNQLNQRFWGHDPEGLLRLSGLDFLCDYETEAESTFENMAIKNPKLFRLRNKLGLKPDE